MKLAALILSGLSVLVSIAAVIAAWKSRRDAKRSADAAQRMASIEADRRAEEVDGREKAERARRDARLVVRAGKPVKSMWEVHVTNEGMADAARVEVAVEPDPLSVHGLTHFDGIAQGCSESIRIMLTDQAPRDYTVSISWVDGDGEKESTRDIHVGTVSG